ncbi:hypothetical protein GS453_22630 [Rhodococcus hoagii]|uniref:Succinate dehydogenase/fumarate reductase N-terminal domain-containing protein n=1 Tax=Rhodococcus hoagii TaxID=43767 RepID=A0AAP2AS19_RHOHA|nr:hypothetical protein [Prescottella equi]
MDKDATALPPVPRGRGHGHPQDRRFKPGGRRGPALGELPVPHPADRPSAELLLYVKGYLDGTLTFPSLRAHASCGSDAMRITVVNRLACKVLMRELPRRQADHDHPSSHQGSAGREVSAGPHVALLRAFRAVKPSSSRPATIRHPSIVHPVAGGPCPVRRHHQCILCACCTNGCSTRTRMPWWCRQPGGHVSTLRLDVARGRLVAGRDGFDGAERVDVMSTRQSFVNRQP